MSSFLADPSHAPDGCVQEKGGFRFFVVQPELAKSLKLTNASLHADVLGQLGSSWADGPSG
jgi:hypothetical protein